MEVWAIASREDADTVQAYVDVLGLTFPVLLDSESKVGEQYTQASAFPSAAYPQDWLVGTDGTVVYVNNSFEVDAVVTAIENELDGG